MTLKIASALLVWSLYIFSPPVFSGSAGYQVVTEEWAPYSYLDKGSLVGISVDIVKELMNISNVNFPIRVLPSMRVSYASKTEQKTIIMSLFRTKEREGRYKWVGPIIEESIFPYRLSSSLPIPNTLDDLKSIRKITTRTAGLTIPNIMLAHGFENIDAIAANSDQLYKILFAKRTDVIVGDTDLGVRYYLHKLNLPYVNIERIPVEIFHSELFIAFSLDSDDSIVNAWTTAFATMKENGTLERILEKYQ